jgi:hypothetical protein
METWGTTKVELSADSAHGADSAQGADSAEGKTCSFSTKIKPSKTANHLSLKSPPSAPRIKHSQENRFDNFRHPGLIHNTANRSVIVLDKSASRILEINLQRDYPFP